MATQIFFRMEVSAEEKAEILRLLDVEHAGDSFSNVNRQMWGLEKLNRSESLRGNENKKMNLGKYAKLLRSKLAPADNPIADPHKIERRFQVLLDASNNAEIFNRNFEYFRKMFAQRGIKINEENLNADIEKLLSGDQDVKREWARGFWGTTET